MQGLSKEGWEFLNSAIEATEKIIKEIAKAQRSLAAKSANSTLAKHLVQRSGEMVQKVPWGP
eukprot:1993127-Alexandrium_andersonii.AAC.1